MTRTEWAGVHPDTIFMSRTLIQYGWVAKNAPAGRKKQLISEKNDKEGKN